MSKTNQQDERFWDEMADELRDALRLRPLTTEEAEAEYDAADGTPLPEDEIEGHVQRARDAVPQEKSYAERVRSRQEQATLEDEVGQVIGLNRNGDGDDFAADVEEEMRRQREAADQEDDDEPDEDGNH